MFQSVQRENQCLCKYWDSEGSQTEARLHTHVPVTSGPEGVFFSFRVVKCVLFFFLKEGEKSYSWESSRKRKRSRPSFSSSYLSLPLSLLHVNLPPFTHLGLCGSFRNLPHTPETTILSYLYKYCICIIETGKTSETETRALACWRVAGLVRGSLCRWCSFN